MKKSKSHNLCKTAMYKWSYGSSCLEYLNSKGISTRRFKKWYFSRLLNATYTIKDIKISRTLPLCIKDEVKELWKTNCKTLG